MALIARFSSNPSGAVVLVSCCLGQLNRSQELAGMVLKREKTQSELYKADKNALVSPIWKKRPTLAVKDEDERGASMNDCT